MSTQGALAGSKDRSRKYILIWLETGKAEQLDGPILAEWTKGLKYNHDGWFKVWMGEEYLVVEQNQEPPYN